MSECAWLTSPPMLVLYGMYAITALLGLVVAVAAIGKRNHR